MKIITPLESLPLWERGFKQFSKRNEVLDIMSLPLWERGFKRGVTRKIKNAIERADQGSFYFVLFPQFYMYQTNKLRKEKSKNRLKYNYEREKDENSIFRKNRCRKQ